MKRTEEEIKQIDERICEAIGLTSEDYNAHIMNLMRRYVAAQDETAPIGILMYHPFTRVFDMYHAERNAQLLGMLDKLDEGLTMCVYKDSRDQRPLDKSDIIILDSRAIKRRLFEYHHHGLDCLFYRKSTRLASAFNYYLKQYQEEYVQ